MQLSGFHHMSSYSGHIARSVDFYTRVLGLRLVIKTVNQDDTDMYHILYGDRAGTPGTLLTFFDVPFAARTRAGTNSISAIGLRVPDRAAVQWWAEKLTDAGVDHNGLEERDGRAMLRFFDTDGQPTQLVADGEKTIGQIAVPWNTDLIPLDKAIRGIDSATLTVPKLELTARLLTDVLGFRESHTYTNSDHRPVVVFETGLGGAGSEVHIEERADLPREKLGSGGIHHIAFATTDEAAISQWQGELSAAGYHNSGVVDRYYFQSLYFRDPNGILFELATAEGPGIPRDSGIEHLGERLELPAFLEPDRAQIEARLDPLPAYNPQAV